MRPFSATPPSLDIDENIPNTIESGRNTPSRQSALNDNEGEGDIEFDSQIFPQKQNKLEDEGGPSHEFESIEINSESTAYKKRKAKKNKGNSDDVIEAQRDTEEMRESISNLTDLKLSELGRTGSGYSVSSGGSASR